MKQAIPLETAHRLLGCGSVVLVTASAKGRSSIMPAAWATPLSIRPPLIGVCINQAHFTAELVRRSEQFGLSVPSAELLHQVQYCGSVSGRDVDKWDQTGLHPAEPHKIDIPLIDECIAHLECGVVQAVDITDHTMFIGQVLYAAVEEGIFTDRWLLEDRDAKPLHHLGGPWYGVLEEAIKARGENE
jgi:flavin reductase (DIM6/NTAB) family NADH-FMN oxidoreductase RutF